jgi:hypothetical protein
LLWFAKRIRPFASSVVLGMLPCPDLLARYRMRRTARQLVSLRVWPGMEATSVEAAQLAMLRLLWLQRQTRRAVRGRHREAAIMLARACVETLLLGLYCLREPKAVQQLNGASIRAGGNAIACLGTAGIVPADVIAECVAALGTSRSPLKVWDMVLAIDAANDNTAARYMYQAFYVPLSEFTVHANGGTLMRHVRRHDKLASRPLRASSRRSPVRVADGVTALLAAAIAADSGKPHQKLVAYAERHNQRALLPIAFIGITGLGGVFKPRRLPEIIKTARATYNYLWHGQAAADSLDERTAYVKAQYGAMIDAEAIGLPAGALDPFIAFVAAKLAGLVSETEAA